MYRTDRIYVTENHELYAYLDDFAHKAKCLHNAALFRIRNAFTAHNKTALTANEKEVQGELALLKGQKSYYVPGYVYCRGLCALQIILISFPGFLCRLHSMSSDRSVQISKAGLPL